MVANAQLSSNFARHTDDSLLGHAQTPHLDQVLRNLGETLLALVGDEVGPVDELLVDLLKGLGVVVGKLDALPEVGGRVRTLDRLDVEIENTCRISRVHNGSDTPASNASDSRRRRTASGQ